MQEASSSLIHWTSVPKAAASRRLQEHAWHLPCLHPSQMAVEGLQHLWGSAGNSNPFPFLNSGSEDPWFSSACPNHQHTQPFSALVLHINYLKYSTDNSSYKMYVPHWAHYRTSCSWVVQFMPRRWPTWAYRHQKEIHEHTKIHNIN